VGRGEGARVAPHAAAPPTKLATPRSLSTSLPLSPFSQNQVGPELELTGYGCEDHFLEPDTEAHAWDALSGLLVSGHTDG